MGIQRSQKAAHLHVLLLSFLTLCSLLGIPVTLSCRLLKDIIVAPVGCELEVVEVQYISAY